MPQDRENPIELYVPVDVWPNKVPVRIAAMRPRFFPPPFQSTADGLVCLGGSLEPAWLMDAYQHGIFPWPVCPDQPMAWWSPHPRAVVEFEDFHVSRSLRRTIRGGRFRASCDQDFEGVIRGCATAAGRRGSTWLTPEMIQAYCRMHGIGHAHSVEVWIDQQLAGGTYGVAIGGFFAAESMFYRVRDASKVALAYLMAHLRAREYLLLDVQQWTEHTGRLGATEISRNAYLLRLMEAVAMPMTFGEELAGEVNSL